MTPAAPLELSRPDDATLRIRWSDGEVRDYKARDLRDACPCATCREKHKAPAPPPTTLTVLAPEELAPVRLEAMRPAGTYAYNLRFSDGHNTGLYTFDLLKRLGAEVP